MLTSSSRALATPPSAARTDRNIPSAARALFLALRALKGGTLTVHMPAGAALVFGDGAGPAFEMRVRDYRFAQRILFNGDIGFAEGWIEGDWDSDDLPGLLTFLLGNYARIQRYISGGLTGRALNFLRHIGRTNTRSGSRRNILAHYDLGNQFYETWLDPTMTYSSARFTHEDQPLEAAQHNKFASLARMIELKPDDHLLEIGCGWGGFALFAAKECGARVTAVTISDAQLAYARRRVAAAGLDDRITIERRDYRDITGSFDRIVSIEMFEAVGERYWPAFFLKVHDVLKPGGRVALQTINMRDDLFAQYRTRSDFIQRYVFPGGMLPSIQRLRDETARAGLVWQECEDFGRDYAKTLELWSASFAANHRAISALGFDETFCRFWQFYLAYCRAGFATGRVSVAQWSLVRR